MRPYVVYLNEGALGFAPRSGQQRRMVMDFIRSAGSQSQHHWRLFGNG